MGFFTTSTRTISLVGNTVAAQETHTHTHICEIYIYIFQLTTLTTSRNITINSFRFFAAKRSAIQDSPCAGQGRRIISPKTFPLSCPVQRRANAANILFFLAEFHDPINHIHYTRPAHVSCIRIYIHHSFTSRFLLSVFDGERLLSLPSVLGGPVQESSWYTWYDMIIIQKRNTHPTSWNAHAAVQL